ncbi:MAG: GIY-YIG nuclease family protein [Proteobacteria bacterium]|nr:GIY-YIG nuclease family protein [Pseudomonadota bacterium]
MNRKELIRQYKETRRPMGVYRVHNTVSGKSLVGVSSDLQAILNRHQAQLGFGMHPNRGLQNDWNALGREAFAFEVLDTLTPLEGPDYDPSEDLKVLEALWLEKLSPFDDRGYNAKPKPVS